MRKRRQAKDFMGHIVQRFSGKLHIFKQKKKYREQQLRDKEWGPFGNGGLLSLERLTAQEHESVLEAINAEQAVVVAQSQGNRSRVEVTRTEMRTLVPWRPHMRDSEQWLDDKLMEMGLRLIVDDANAQGQKVAMVNSFFFTRLTRGGYDYAAVRRWTRRIAVQELDALLVPLHQGVHWALGVVNLRMRRFEAYDSLHAGPCIKHYCATLARWLKDEEPPLHDNRQKLGRKYTPGQCLCST